ncbi:hypothetical protein P7C71_g3878, partial [Lecanoromycetidae sp. Uapishka_2]
MAGPFSLRICFFLAFLSHPISFTAAQQVGSFFTAVYLNGAPISSSQTSCSEMGQPLYCCGSGYSCGWDDAGKVACCASGTTCEGSAYGSGASAGAGQYYTSSSYYSPEQTTTVYQTQSQGCDCESTTVGNVVPIVPVTVATVLTPSTTSYYVPPTSTIYPVTTTTTPFVAGAVKETTTVSNCPNGYSTFVEANVGAPTRTVGCQVIINGGMRLADGAMRNGVWMLGILWLLNAMG